MSTDVADRLRTLAQEHHDGRIDLAAYRALRGPLLDSLASGVPVPATEITQPRVAHRQMQRDAITRPGKPRVASPPAPDTQPAPLQTSRRLRKVAVWIGMAIVVVAVAVIWMWFQQGRVRSDGTESDRNVAAAPPRAVRNAVDQFMAAGDWGDGPLIALNATLMELGGEQIAPLTHEPGFQRFVDELRRRLKEQQALSPTTLTVNNSPLAALAVTVGVDLNSPDAALHIVAVPPAHVAETNAGGVARGNLNAAAGRTHAGSAPPGVDASAASTASAVSAVSTAPAPAASADAANAANAANAAAEPVVTTTTYPDPCRRDLIGSRRPLCQDSLTTGEAPLMALVPAGAFEMGSTAAPEEQPVHHVNIPDAFGVSVNEVSQGEFKHYCEAMHRQCSTQPWSGDDYPVVNVSWNDARGYVEWLSAETHHHYSLPTEAQWEYAARAGNNGLYPSGTVLSPTDAHFSMLKKETAAARRSQKFNANAFRLLHTVGNVREWVEDPWAQSYAGAPSDGTALKSAKPLMRVARGGSYTDGSARLRLSMREGLAPDTRDVTTGFRIVRELQRQGG